MATIQASDIAAIFDKLRAARAELTDCSTEIDVLRKRIAELTTCDCGAPLSIGKCNFCDDDE